jgi:hypothetical protein
MKLRRFLLPALLPAVLLTGIARAERPISVEAFTFDSLATRRATFQLPDQGPWRRILMHYTLQCDERTPGDQYPCGEWDVNTYTRVWLHTGRMDSTLHRQARFIANGESPDELLYSTEPRWSIIERRAVHPGGQTSGSYLHFAGTDHLELPAAAFAETDSALTITFWCKGSPEQPVANSIVEAGERGGRLVNIHLPWSTGTVYWDAGGRLSGNTNRIAKQAAPGQFKGNWNHWAFVKDARSGRMAIYLNGALWHEAGNMSKSMAGIDRFVVGANQNANGGWYKGSIDAMRFYDAALDAAEIASLMDAAELPRQEDLIAAYDFDRDSPGLILDSGPRGNHARPFGLPQHRPYGLFVDGDLLPGGELQRDSIPAAKLSVVLRDDPANPEAPTDTLQLWPAFDEILDADGRLLEQLAIENPDTLHQSWQEWHGEPFELVESIEIGRFITPYGKRLDLGEDGFTWTVDVTDYAPLLRGEVELQAHNGYELLDLRFEFIPGEPARDVLAIDNLWPGGDFKYGALADNDELKPLRLTLREDAAGFAVRSRISGHGHAGPRNCCEWDPKEHSLLVNGLPRFDWTIWRDCGFNPVHPQGGTWQFDRAGWCPGTFVDTHLAELTPFVSPGEEIALDYQVEAYDPEIAEEEGRFYIEQQLFSYGPIRARRDVAVDRILAPNDHDELRRINPISTEPIVVIRNLGSEPLRSVELRYGLAGGKSSAFGWRGELAFGAADTLTLPKPDWSGLEEGAQFEVELKAPNGRKDQYREDNRASSRCPAPIILPAQFTLSAELPGFERWLDNAWAISDAAGDTVAARESYPAAGIIDDPVVLTPGAYVLTFSDSEEDGLIRHWWLRGSDPESMGENGRLRILDGAGEELLDLGYDFAEKRVLRFFVGEPR